MASRESPLAGLKVLDMSRVLAGPFAGRMLCDLGADVVKVEPPEGDVTRMWGKVVGGVPGYYHQQNAGKRDICVDLQAPGARELVLELVRKADILLENFRPDVMPRLGLGYDALKAVNPRLIMLSISGFGHGGPESRRPAYAPIVHAEVGLMHRAHRRSGAPHTELPLSVADTNASLHGLVGVLAAVILRERTGVGQHVDIAMIDATLVTDDQIHYELEDSEGTMGLPNDVWAAGPGDILMSADFRHLFRQLTEKLGLKDPAAPDTPLAEKIRLRRAAVGDFLAGLPDWEAVEAAMAAMNIAWGQVRAGAALAEQPTIRARGSIAQVDDRAGGTRPIPQSPYRYSDAVSEVRGVAPHRGEHNETVLAEWLGKGEADVAALYAAGVLLRDEAQ
ncbi:CaiB/BaiF CoA-transferase family protein [uncultured Phenylobacterium sp.]|uniref:CaiB/BaiF CoA transferase family protein n=1 Tax=uncultured Phenylobacterium sp. TaxID=349273 RepID=UPI0025E4BC86|nr:CaiB/BaiF CoA-transferase family protein [uncultured Phenylobacterium sp.]